MDRALSALRPPVTGCLLSVLCSLLDTAFRPQEGQGAWRPALAESRPRRTGNMWNPAGNKGKSLAALGVATAVAALTVLGTSVPASAREGAIVGAAGDGAIPGSYIVVLKHSDVQVSAVA